MLAEVKADHLGGLDEKVREDVEFLVDSGAAATVIGANEIKAVRASAPDPDKHYKMADGSLILRKGCKQFAAVS